MSAWMDMNQPDLAEPHYEGSYREAIDRARLLWASVHADDAEQREEDDDRADD